MTCGFDQIQAGVNTVVDHLGPVHAIFLFEVGIESSLDIVEDRPPSVSRT